MKAWRKGTRSICARLLGAPQQSSWAFASQLVTSGANFAATVIIVRCLGLLEFGRFSICFLLLMITRNLLNGILLAAMSTIAPKLSVPAQKYYRGFLLMQICIFAGGTSLILYSSAMAFGIATGSAWIVELAPGLALANLFANGADFLRRYHFAQNASHRAFTTDFSRFAVQTCLLLCFSIFWENKFSANTALFVLAISSALGLTMGVRNFGSLRWSKRFTGAVWPRHWNFIKWQSPSVMLETIQSNLPLLVGAAMLGETIIGVVRAMQSLANILILPLNAVQQIAPSMAARTFAAQEMTGLQSLLRRVTFGNLAALIGLSVPAMLLSKQLITIGFGIEFERGLPIFLLFCLLNVLLVLRLPLVILFQTFERPKILALSEAFGLMASIVTSLFLIAVVGAVGVPLAFLFATIATMTCLWVAFVFSTGMGANPATTRWYSARIRTGWFRPKSASPLFDKSGSKTKC